MRKPAKYWTISKAGWKRDNGGVRRFGVCLAQNDSALHVMKFGGGDGALGGHVQIFIVRLTDASAKMATD